MTKTVIAAASYYKRGYAFNNAFDVLPAHVKEEIKAICVLSAEKLRCVFSVGFYEDCGIYFETVVEDAAIDFDEIGAKLETDRISRERSELLGQLSLWYKTAYNV